MSLPSSTRARHGAWFHPKAHRRMLAAVAATTLLVLTACSGESTTTSTPSATAEAPKVFAVGTSASISTLDPNKAVDQAQLQIHNLIGGT